MQGSQQDGTLLPSADTSCQCAGKESCEISDLTACIRTQKAFCALNLLLKEVQAGNDMASAFFQESLAAEDALVLSLLVGEAKQGSDSAFRFLYEHYWPTIFAHIALMIGNRHDIANELTQEAFFKAWKELPRTNEETPRKFKSWLYKIASNLTYDYFRRPGQSRSFIGSLERENGAEEMEWMGRNGKPLSSVEGPEDIICETELVKQAFSQVKPRYREALWLEAYTDGTQAEKAKQLHIGEGTFSGYVHRGREELKAAYRRLAEDLEIQVEGGSDYE